MLAIVFCLIFIINILYAQKCIPRKFQEDSVVCVCNSTYCDFLSVDIPSRNKFRKFISSRSGKRLDNEIGEFNKINKYDIALKLNVTKTFQSIQGFGSAFTDSAGINIKKLSNKTQENLLRSYFAVDGSRYNLCRVPIGGTDFSTRPYTLDDVPNDVNLKNFNLAKEDIDYKIPYMKHALKINPQLRFVSAAWSAPAWMKTNENLRGFLGLLKVDYYQNYANYLVKFLESYKNEGLPIWAISTGNEPMNAFIPFVPINDMGWTPFSVSKWVVDNLGPTIRNSSSHETLILALDDQRYTLPWYITLMYQANPKIDEYIAGIAIHWYGDVVAPVNIFDFTNNIYPNKFIIMTEACTGSSPLETKKVRLGSWKRGEEYMSSIIQDINHWVVGWIDWNMALDKKGGPTWANNFLDSPIIVNPETDEFFKEPMYYSLAHFSKFIPRGSKRIDLTNSYAVKSVAFLTPDNNIVVVLFNPNDVAEDITVIDPNLGNININLEEHSFQTIIYSQ